MGFRRPSLAALWLLAFAAGGLLCSAHAATDAPPPTPPGAEPPIPDEPLFAAPTTRDHIGRVVAPVMINGQGPYRFVVDTGATRSVLSGKLAAALNLANVGKAITVQVAGVTGAMEVSAVAVDRLQAGDLVLENMHLPVINAVLAGTDGILGVEGLEDKRLVVDFRRDRILIQNSTRAAPGNYLVVPVQLEFHRLLVAEAFVGRVKTKAIIDTGAERTLGNMALREALRIGKDPRRHRDITVVEGVTADLQSGEYVRTPSLVLGDVKINQIAVTFGDLHVFEVWGYQDEPAIVLGMDVLGTLSSLVIDYKRKELQLLPYDAPLTVRFGRFGRLSLREPPAGCLNAAPCRR